MLGPRPLDLDSLVVNDRNASRVGAVHRVWSRQVILDPAEEYFG